MPDPYVTVFRSTLQSTVWQRPDPVRIVWMTLLMLADQDGCVFGSIPGIAHTARVSVADCETAIREFQEPDHYSRDPSNDGRRLELIDGGFRLLNYAKWVNLARQKAKEKSISNSDGYVYFIGHVRGPSRLVKIGYSKNPWARLEGIQTGNSRKLKILATVRCPFAVEGKLHKILAKWHVKGEWFNLGGEINAVISDINEKIITSGDELIVATGSYVANYNTEAEAEAEADKKKKNPTGSKKTARKRAFPNDFSLTADRAAKANSKGLNPESEFEKFESYHKAHGSLFSDWDAAWRNWCVKAVEFKPQGSSPSSDMLRGAQ